VCIAFFFLLMRVCVCGMCGVCRERKYLSCWVYCVKTSKTKYVYRIVVVVRVCIKVVVVSKKS
jgi:hypothetical protein